MNTITNEETLVITHVNEFSSIISILILTGIKFDDNVQGVIVVTNSLRITRFESIQDMILSENIHK